MNSSAHRLVATCETLRDLIKDVKATIFAMDPTYELSIEELPAFDIIFPRLGVETKEDPFIPYPLIESRPAISDVCMYLHSSGSTGLPKTIPQTNGTLLNWAASCKFIYNHIPTLSYDANYFSMWYWLSRVQTTPQDCRNASSAFSYPRVHGSNSLRVA